RTTPSPVLIDLNLAARGDSKMQIQFTMKIFKVTVTVDKTRQNGLAGDIDYFCSRRNGKLTSSPHALETPVLYDNDSILDGRSSTSVDERSTLNRQSAASHSSSP
ncbi:MAG: hypothetical protein QOD94_279, partial [Alphaproteobacteria bacterium]|nr:hypothetical protein [Alphaproteobacteria bacterium]